ncbi:MAG: ABC transporter ATP-binding protein/permease [Pseudomonadota bacterium]|nr:ABC transporter ATP-binding protein/permease [Alphaproteobacteria bacterium]MDP5012754.1 ABC transporter ATP-binding protein/permease [Alphaproteobacteria bacterium]MDP5370355.1 ABC transporter ATP-binding protein/permease [Pseudomonadota bacterium]
MENIKKPKIITFKRLWPFLWPRDLKGAKTRLVIAVLALIVSKSTLILVPLIFKSIIDALTEHKSFNVVFVWVGLYGLVRILSSFFSEMRDTTFASVTQRALRQVGLDVFEHLHQLSLRFHIARHTGGVSRIIERGTKAIETLMTFLTFNIVPTALEILMVSVALSLMYDVRYTFVIVITMILYIAYTLKLTEWRIRYVREMNDADTSAQSKAIDSLLNYETVKYFGNELHERHRFDVGLIAYEKSAVQNKWSLSYLNFGQAVVLSFGLIAIVCMAALDVQKGAMTTGDLVAINTFLFQLTIPLFNLGFAYREIKLSLVNIEQMFQLLNEPREICDASDAVDIVDIKTGVTFEHVDFHYDSDRSILKDMNFTIRVGHTVAVVGSSGAGKSTLARLLFRFYDVIGGAVKIDGVDIRKISQKSLRAMIGIVPQDTVLFNDTIHYNIAYGNPNATEPEIINAAKKAEIYDFIESLPKKFETLVGERGLRLSGGEKQRVAIARTLLKKPIFFIFDEATSALDTKTEKLIQDNLERISKNKTTLTIAHRLSTVIHADTILVLDKGVVAEMGSHDELLTKGGLYAQMWQRQQQEVKEELIKPL